MNTLIKTDIEIATHVAKYGGTEKDALRLRRRSEPLTRKKSSMSYLSARSETAVATDVRPPLKGCMSLLQALFFLPFHHLFLVLIFFFLICIFYFLFLLFSFFRFSLFHSYTYTYIYSLLSTSFNLSDLIIFSFSFYYFFFFFFFLSVIIVVSLFPNNIVDHQCLL